MMRLRPALIGASAAALVVCGATLHGAYAAMNDRHAHPSTLHVYKLDYTLSVTEEGHAPRITNLTASLEDGEKASINAGANIPLQTANVVPGGIVSPRQDVGLRLRSQAKRAGSDVLLRVDFEMSSAGERSESPVAIRKVVTEGDALVTPGVPTVVAAVDEPGTHTHYDLTVLVTRLR